MKHKLRAARKIKVPAVIAFSIIIATSLMFSGLIVLETRKVGTDELALITGAGYIKSCTTVTQGQVTWTFDKAYSCGQFVNDEWWVVGPVTLTSITPGATTEAATGLDLNGSMINPSTVNVQGLDARGRPGANYEESTNIAKRLPMAIAGNSSILSSVSRADLTTSKTKLVEAVVLTVLPQVPPQGSFRPPYQGTDKTLFNKSQLNYEVFRDLEPTPNTLSPQSLVDNDIKNPIVMLLGGGGAQKDSELKAPNAPTYGREISKAHGYAALALNMNYTDAQKEELLIEMVQRGIDVYGAVKSDFRWDPDGGHRMGYKLPLYIAGKALGSQDMLARVNPNFYGAGHPAEVSPFQEDRQYDYITEERRLANSTWPAELVGLPDYVGRAQLSQYKRESYPSWDNGYRTMNSSRTITNVLVVTLMGDRALWNNEAMFEYAINRAYPYYSAKGSFSGNFIPRFTYEVWEKYFDGPFTPMPTPTPTQTPAASPTPTPTPTQTPVPTFTPVPTYTPIATQTPTPTPTNSPTPTQTPTPTPTQTPVTPPVVQPSLTPVNPTQVAASRSSGGGSSNSSSGRRSTRRSSSDSDSVASSGTSNTSNTTNSSTASTQTQTTTSASSFSRDLELNAEGSDVVALQNALIAKGYLAAGYNTGYFGSLTRSALIRFQQSANISPAVGYFGPITKSAILGGSVPAQTYTQTYQAPVAVATPVYSSTFTRDLDVGSSGDDVRRLQVFLNARGYTVAESGPGSSGNESTYYGPATKSALARYQYSTGLSPVNGIFGPSTRQYINGRL